MFIMNELVLWGLASLIELLVKKHVQLEWVLHEKNSKKTKQFVSIKRKKKNKKNLDSHLLEKFIETVYE